MKIFITLGLITLFGFVGSSSALACHEGGPMGFAKRDPGMVTIDITYSPTFTSASTSGTSGCKNWDLVQRWKKQRQQFVIADWKHLKRESAQGKGQHLKALAHLMGCPTHVGPEFERQIQVAYPTLFAETSALLNSAQATTFLNQLDHLIAHTPNLQHRCTPDVSS